MKTIQGFYGQAHYPDYDGFNSIVFVSDELFTTRGRAIQWAIDTHPDSSPGYLEGEEPVDE